MDTVTEVEELVALKKLLQIEKKEDYEQHKLLIERLPLEERKKKGYSWYPLQVIKKGTPTVIGRLLLLNEPQIWMSPINSDPES